MSQALNVLIAEDEVPIAMGLARQLELLGHRVVAQAADGRQAVEMAAQQPVDLAVLDIRMPELDGIDAARRINETKPTPVIMVTAYCQEDLVSRAADAGVYAYLAKPVRPDELRSAIAIALKRFDESRQMTQEVEQLKLTLQERKVIERAKGVIMRRLGLSEEQAYQRLRRESQNTRKPMAKIAQAVVEAESLLASKEFVPPDAPEPESQLLADEARPAVDAPAPDGLEAPAEPTQEAEPPAQPPDEPKPDA